MKQAVLWVWVVLLAAVLSGCQPDTVCRMDLTIGLTATLVGDSIANSKTVNFSTWDSISVTAIGKDSVLYDNQKNVGKLMLPLKITDTTTVFVLVYHRLADTLRVTYDNDPRFISMECGCAVYQNIHSVSATTHWIDEIYITQTEITPARENNLILVVHGGKHP